MKTPVLFKQTSEGETIAVFPQSENNYITYSLHSGYSELTSIDNLVEGNLKESIDLWCILSSTPYNYKLILI